MVSHDLNIVMAKTNRVLCLNQHLCCQGQPETITQDAAFLALFGQHATLYTHHHNHQHTIGGAVIDKGEVC